jgi:hypothetical protein
MRRILGGAKPVSRPLPDPAVSPAGAFPGWPDSSAWQAGPARARAGRDGLGETWVRTGLRGSPDTRARMWPVAEAAIDRGCRPLRNSAGG